MDEVCKIDILGGLHASKTGAGRQKLLQDLVLLLFAFAIAV